MDGPWMAGGKIYRKPLSSPKPKRMIWLWDLKTRVLAQKIQEILITFPELQFWDFFWNVIFQIEMVIGVYPTGPSRTKEAA
jgi:hypothetical protein